MGDNDGQMIIGDLKLPDICLTGEEKPRKNLTQETCPDRGSNPGPLRDKRASYHLLHRGGRLILNVAYIFIHGVREISAIIVTDDYLCYKEPESYYNFFLF